MTALVNAYQKSAEREHSPTRRLVTSGFLGIVFLLENPAFALA
jgi:hypothetical protein